MYTTDTSHGGVPAQSINTPASALSFAFFSDIPGLEKRSSAIHLANALGVAKVVVILRF